MIAKHSFGMVRTEANRRARGALALLATIGLAGAACGGGSGSKKPTGADNAAATTTTTGGETTPNLGSTQGTSTTIAASAAPGIGGSTTSVAKRTSATTTKRSAITAAPSKAVTGGITNVTSVQTTAAGADVQPGGTLTYVKAADNAALDPIRIQGQGKGDGSPAFMIYDVLVYDDLKDGVVKPQTADSLTSTDAVVWTLKIKPNIHFSDGTTYDATAVKFNWQRLQDPANAAARAAQANLIAQLDVLNPLTLKITLKAKNAVFPQAVALIPFVGSPAAIQSEGNDQFNNAPVGAGPFIMKSWVRDSSLVLTRNPNYWNAPLPYLDQIIVKPIPDETQRMNTFQTGGANMLATNLAQTSDTLTKNGGVPYPAVINGGTVMYFNTRTKPFSDPRARQAVVMAIDRTDTAKTIDSGLLPAQQSIFREGSPFRDPGILQLPYDPVKAQQLFDQVAADNGGTLSFSLTSYNTGVYAIAVQYFQSVLNKFNHVNVTAVPEGNTLHTSRVNSGDFQAALTSAAFDDPEPVLTGLFTCNAPNSPSGFCDSTFDSLVVDQRQTLDANKRIADVKEMQKILYAQAPVLFWETRAAFDVAAPNVQNVVEVNDGLALYDRIWIKSRG